MARVVTEPCKGNKHAHCCEVCPVDCFYEMGDMLVINPNDCIDCGACESECPESAIFPDVECDQKWVKINAEADFDSLKNITSRDQVTR